ncbi:multidrug efflux RND transporter permease subunit, partial [Salipiger sp. HF18]|uniref:efflux RND transporter permease subunit n=1 Tax=Salipiger sp. HF18 TaxID=2721557 RepID=UPI00158C6B72
GPAGWFNKGFDKTTDGYAGTVGWLIRRPFRVLILYAALGYGMVFLFNNTPTGFLPDEDQGILLTLVQAPTGATAERTLEVVKQVENHFSTNEQDSVDSVFGVVGFSFAGQGQNMGLAFVRMKDWDERPSPAQSVQAVAGRAFPAFMGIQDAMVFPIVPPSVIELGNVSGFDFYLQAQAGQTHEQLLEARNQLLGMAAQSPILGSVRPNGLEDASQFNLDIDWRAAGAIGVSPTNVGNLLSVAWAGSYVNDFNDNGRIKRVYVQGSPESRATPSDLQKWRGREAHGGGAPPAHLPPQKRTPPP